MLLEQIITEGASSKNFWEDKKNYELTNMVGFRRITLFCLGYRLSKHKMTIRFKNFFGGHCPVGPPGYSYES